MPTLTLQKFASGYPALHTYDLHNASSMSQIADSTEKQLSSGRTSRMKAMVIGLLMRRIETMETKLTQS